MYTQWVVSVGIAVSKVNLLHLQENKIVQNLKIFKQIDNIKR